MKYNVYRVECDVVDCHTVCESDFSMARACEWAKESGWLLDEEIDLCPNHIAIMKQVVKEHDDETLPTPTQSENA